MKSRLAHTGLLGQEIVDNLVHGYSFSKEVLPYQLTIHDFEGDVPHFLQQWTKSPVESICPT